jgi:flagellin
MALTITNNIASLNAQENLSRSSSALGQSLQRLSSGLKINTGADGPAALVISEEQRAQISGLQAAINNTSKGISLIQTTEGALNEINSLLDQVRGLALDSANSAVLDTNAQAANQAQLAQALGTIDRIAQTTQFGTKKVLDGTAGMTGFSTAPSSVQVLQTTSAAAPGAYQVNVTTAGQQAVVNGSAPIISGAQTLANAEQLTINGVQVNLAAGSNQQGVLNAINAATPQTGVVAEVANNVGVQSNASTKAAETVDTAAFLTNAGGNPPAVAGTLLKNLQGYTAATNGDVITITGTDAKGNAVNGPNFTVTAATSTLGQLASAVAAAYNATDATGNYTASIKANGDIELRSGNPTNASLSLTLGFTSAGGTYTPPTVGANNGVSSTTAVTTATQLNGLSGSNGLYQAGDTLVVGGTRADGSTITAAQGTITLGANATVNDVVNGLQSAFGSGYTASFTNGKFVVTDNKDANASAVAFSITDGAGNKGSDATDFSLSGFTTSVSTLRLHSQTYGSAATIAVQSNQAAGAGTTGIGTGILNGTGVDIAGNINGYAATGQGNVLIGSAADKAAGIAVAVTGKNPTYDTLTQTGNNLATVTVQNNSMTFQIGANSGQTASIAVDNAGTKAIGIGVSGDQFTNLNQINITTQSGAQDALKVIDQAIADISNLRGRLGAFQANTLQATATDLQTTLTNTTSAESVIRDTDFAQEMSSFTKNQVLVQAGTTVLSNANQTNQLVLNLLQGH